MIMSYRNESLLKKADTWKIRGSMFASLRLMISMIHRYHDSVMETTLLTSDHNNDIMISDFLVGRGYGVGDTISDEDKNTILAMLSL